jgi:hypothetical protein
MNRTPVMTSRNWKTWHSWGLPRILSGILFLSPLALLGCVPNEDLGDEWATPEPGESRISFQAADEASSQMRFFRHQLTDYSRTIEIRTWSTADLEIGRAEVVYHYLAPRRYFRTAMDLEDAIARISDFEGFNLERGEMINASEVIGVLASRLLYLDQIVTCIVFVRYWGNVGSVPPNGGTQYLYGYYCVDPGEELTVASAKDILGTLDVRSGSL